MKKILRAVACICAGLLLLTAVFCIGHGFTRMSAVCIGDFAVSDDGNEMTVRVMVTSSIGYVRSVRVSEEKDGRLYLDCLSAFGGLNGNIGAKDTFTIPLREDTDVIALYSSDGYRDELVREDGTWRRTVQ